jgi:hypothetical protein
MTDLNVRSRARARIATLAVGLFFNTAAAHHSFAIFNAKQSITLHGVVKQFLWTNPHVFIQLLAEGAAGAPPTEWSIELTSPEHLARAGWRPGTLKSGDKLTVVIHPVRDGSKGGQFVSRVGPDGTQIDMPAHARESK